MIKKITVVVAEGQCVSTVSLMLEQKGCQITAIMEEIGVISASVDTADLNSLKSIPGVLSIEEANDVELAPPDGDVQ